MTLKDNEAYKPWHSILEDDFSVLPEEVEETHCIVRHEDRFASHNICLNYLKLLIDM